MLTNSCTSSCRPLQIPTYIPDPTLSEDENVAASVEQAVNKPLAIKGRSVPKPRLN